MGITFNIAVSGLTAAAEKLRGAAGNLANAQSRGRLPETEGEKATSYQPVRVETLPVTGGGEGLGVRTVTRNLTPAYRVGFDPQSEHANARGEVAMTNVDLATEMVEGKLAEMQYRANAKVVAIAADMEKRMLDELL